VFACEEEALLSICAGMGRISRDGCSNLMSAEEEKAGMAAASRL
jgi:hypothetical protein